MAVAVATEFRRQRKPVATETEMGRTRPAGRTVRRPGSRTMRVLLAEDEVTLCEQIKRVLGMEGRVVDVVHDGEEAAFRGATEPYDMIILDIGLPKRDGISVLKEWRRQNIDVPVLLLTARDGWSDRVEAWTQVRTTT